MSPGVRAIRGPKRLCFFSFRVTEAERAQITSRGGAKWIRNLMRVSRLKDKPHNHKGSSSACSLQSTYRVE